MRKRTVKYRIGEIGKVRVVRDFLPPPEKFVLRQANVKVTHSKRKAAKQRDHA